MPNSLLKSDFLEFPNTRDVFSLDVQYIVFTYSSILRNTLAFHSTELVEKYVVRFLDPNDKYYHVRSGVLKQVFDAYAQNRLTSSQLEKIIQMNNFDIYCILETPDRLEEIRNKFYS
jgi:hypothetical protein